MLKQVLYFFCPFSFDHLNVQYKTQQLLNMIIRLDMFIIFLLESYVKASYTYYVIMQIIFYVFTGV